MQRLAKVESSVKATAGHPYLNMSTLGLSIILMIASSVSGFISYTKLQSSDTNLGNTKTLLLSASLLSLLAAIFLGIGIFLIYRHSQKLEAAFKGFFSVSLLLLSILFMLTSGILYSIVAFRLLTRTDTTGTKFKDTFGTSYKATVASAIMSLGGLGILGISFLVARFMLRKPTTVGAPTGTQIEQKAPYTTLGGAAEQLSQLQTASGIPKRAPSIPGV